MGAADPVLHAVIRAALEATGARSGWLLARAEERRFRVLAVGSEVDARLVGVEVPADAGIAGFVVSSGQPLALSPGSVDPRLSAGVAALLGQAPSTVLCVPCETSEQVLGAIELVDKAGGASFSFDDVEVVTLLADIGAAALASAGGGRPDVPSPEQLAGSLRSLADLDPTQYASVATIVSALLDRV